MPTITGVGVLDSARHFIERKIEAFRAGPGHRIPDLLTDFGRKFDAFLSQFACFGGGGKEKPTDCCRAAAAGGAGAQACRWAAARAE